MNYIDEIEKYKDDLIKYTCELLKINSELTLYDEKNIEFPFGEGIRKALDYTLGLGSKFGFETKNINNFAGHIEFGQGEEVLGILAHLDVVPAGDESKWTYPPYSATIEKGMIYARGAVDDKGPILSALYAMKMLKDEGFVPNKKVRLILGTDEETGMRGVKKYLENEAMPDIAFTPDANFPLINGEKGIISMDVFGELTTTDIISYKSGERYNVVPDYAEVTLKKNLNDEYLKFLEENKYDGEVKGNKLIAYGKSAHAMVPEKGINANNILIEFLEHQIDDDFITFYKNHLLFDDFGYELDIDFSDDVMGDYTQNVGIVSVESNKVKIGINSRFPKGYNTAESLNKIRLAAKESNFQLNVLREDKPLFVSEDDPLVKVLFESYKKYTDDDVNKPFSIGGGTYSKSLKKCVAFGPLMPGRVDSIHQPNEHIHIDDLLTSAAIYAEAIKGLCK